MRVKRGGNNRRVLRIMDNLDKILEKSHHEAIQDLADAIFEDSQRTCPVDRSYLLHSGYVRHEERQSVVGYSAKHARIVHEGSKPHEIRPKTKKVLRFEPERIQRLERGKGKAQYVFAKKVHHPGTSPNPWLKRSALKMLPKAGEFIKKRFRINIEKVSA